MNVGLTFIFLLIISFALGFVGDVLIDAFSDLIHQARIQKNKEFYEKYDEQKIKATLNE